MVRNVAVAMLEGLGYFILTAETGHSALQVLKDLFRRCPLGFVRYSHARAEWNGIEGVDSEGSARNNRGAFVG
jgi:hypothetical protein